MQATLTINLCNVTKNYTYIQKIVGKHVQVAAAVKCNAYGLGMGKIAQTLHQNGCKEFYVARLSEAIQLRKVLKSSQIYVLDGIMQGETGAFLKAKVVPVLNNQRQINLWEKCAVENNKILKCCIHIDSGMTRLGVDTYLADETLNTLAHSKYLKIAYVLSHLACSDEKNSAMNKKQLNFIQALKKKHPQFKYSFANSAGIFLGKSYHFDQVRPGNAIYGGCNKYPVAELIAPIIDIHRIQAQSTVGYGATYKLSPGQIIATIPVGYGDGYFRCLGNRGHCFINDMKVNIVGRISMDLLCLDISKIPSRFQKIGQTVELIGKHISIEEIATLADTVNYEVFTSLSSRYERKYIWK